MSTLRKNLISAAAVIGVISGAAFPAKAAGVVGIFVWVSGGVRYVTTTTTFPSPPPPGATTTVTTRTLVVWVDPPSFSNIDLTLDYDPSKLAFLGGGTLCDFGTGGDCPAVDTTSGLVSPIPSISSLTLGSELPGSSLSLTTGADSVTLSYDLSGAMTPPTGGADENFFGFVFNPLVPLGNAVTIENKPGSYDITLASETCTLSDKSNCMTNSPTYGYSFSTIPEPSTWAMTLLGFAGLAAAAGLRKGRSPKARARPVSA
jgi:hypothetical protein